jgi:hypothetical protein
VCWCLKNLTRRLTMAANGISTSGNTRLRKEKISRDGRKNCEIFLIKKLKSNKFDSPQMKWIMLSHLTELLKIYLIFLIHRKIYFCYQIHNINFFDFLLNIFIIFLLHKFLSTFNSQLWEFKSTKTFQNSHKIIFLLFFSPPTRKEFWIRWHLHTKWSTCFLVSHTLLATSSWLLIFTQYLLFMCYLCGCVYILSSGWVVAVLHVVDCVPVGLLLLSMWTLSGSCDCIFYYNRHLTAQSNSYDVKFLLNI